MLRPYRLHHRYHSSLHHLHRQFLRCHLPMYRQHHRYRQHLQYRHYHRCHQYHQYHQY